MEKVNPSFANNISFLHMASLPHEQFEKFSDTLNQSDFFSITVGEVKLNHCVSYERYENWFQYYFNGIEAAFEMSF